MNILDQFQWTTKYGRRGYVIESAFTATQRRKRSQTKPECRKLQFSKQNKIWRKRPLKQYSNSFICSNGSNAVVRIFSVRVLSAFDTHTALNWIIFDEASKKANFHGSFFRIMRLSLQTTTKTWKNSFDFIFRARHELALHSYYSEGEWITLFRTRSWANGKSVSGNETALFETHKTSNMQIGNWAEQMLFIQIKCSSCQLFGNTKTGQWKQPTHFSRVWIRIPIRLG